MPKATEFSMLRARAGISIEDFADQAGFSRRTVYRWERGDDGREHMALGLYNFVTPLEEAGAPVTTRSDKPAATR